MYDGLEPIEGYGGYLFAVDEEDVVGGRREMGELETDRLVEATANAVAADGTF